MPSCAILTCKNSSKVANREKGDVSFHRFPQDANFKEKWIEATGNKDWFPTKNSTICSIHFEEQFFATTKKYRRLIDIAYPTIQIVKTTTTTENEDNFDPLSTSTEDPINTPKERQLLKKLKIAQQKNIQQRLIIKKFREQNRRKSQKILTLVSIIEKLKRKSFRKNTQTELLQPVRRESGSREGSVL